MVSSLRKKGGVNKYLPFLFPFLTSPGKGQRHCQGIVYVSLCWHKPFVKIPSRLNCFMPQPCFSDWKEQLLSLMPLLCCFGTITVCQLCLICTRRKPNMFTINLNILHWIIFSCLSEEYSWCTIEVTTYLPVVHHSTALLKWFHRMIGRRYLASYNM